MQVKQTIDAVISDFFKKNMMFTAFDVTTEVRKRLNNQNFYHSVVRDYINDVFTNNPLIFRANDYDRAIGNIPNAGTQPFIYYNPSVHDISQYNNYVTVASVPAPVPMSVPVPVPVAVASTPVGTVNATFKGFSTR